MSYQEMPTLCLDKAATRYLRFLLMERPDILAQLQEASAERDAFEKAFDWGESVRKFLEQTVTELEERTGRTLQDILRREKLR